MTRYFSPFYLPRHRQARFPLSKTDAYAVDQRRFFPRWNRRLIRPRSTVAMRLHEQLRRNQKRKAAA